MFLMDLGGLQPLVQSLGWALVHFIWQGAAIGALFAAGKLLLRHARPHYRYLLGLGSMLLLLLAPIVTFIALFAHPPAPVEPVGVATAFAIATAGTPAAGFDFAGWIEQALPWVVLAWIGGVLVMSARVTVNWYRLLRCVRVGARELDRELKTQAELLIHLFGIRRKVRMLESALVQVPTVFGWLKPVVLLPTSSLVGLTPAQLELVIAHELGHIRRFDYLVNLFQVTVETLLFYHPVVAWISRHVREEREQCCDDLVVKTCGNRLEYAKALTTLETIRSTGGMTPALAATDGQLLKRIERIVCTHGRPRDPVLGNSGVLLIVAAAVILAGRVADPMAALEAQRNMLADALVSELRIGDDANQLFAPLDQARLAPAAPAAPADRIESPAGDRTASAAATPIASGSSATERVADPSVVDPAPPPARAIPSLRAAAIGPTRGVPEIEIEVQAPSGLAAERPLELASLPKAPGLEALRAASRSGPVAIERVSPEYPVRARIAGQEGYVELEFGLRADGRVRDVEVSDSWPRRVFDRAAVRAMREWRFDPASIRNPGDTRLSQRFVFALTGDALPNDKRNCLPLTGTRICRPRSPTSLSAQESVD